MTTTTDTGRVPETAQHRPPGERRPRRRPDFLPLILLAPAVLLVGGLLLYPILRTVWLSFHSLGLENLISGQGPWVGLENYRRLIGDPFFWRVLRNTVLLAVACVSLTMCIGTLVALLLERLPRWGRVILSIFVLLPWAMPHVAAVIVWKWLFDAQYGVVNWLLAALGPDFFLGFSWFLNPLLAFGVITLLVVWQSFPFVALAMLAGLQSIPPEYPEAARVDGASGWAVFWRVTVPLLRPIILILLILSTIWDFKIFTQVYVMTGGGPARSTYVLGLYSWKASFEQIHLGFGAAIAVVILLILLAVSILYVRTLARQEELR